MSRLFVLFAIVAVAVAYPSVPENAVSEEINPVPEETLFVDSPEDNYYMSPENVLAEMEGMDKSWKNMEAEFTQMLQKEDDDTKMAVVFSLKKIAKMDPEVLGKLTMKAMKKQKTNDKLELVAEDSSAEFWGGRRRRRFFKAVARVARSAVRHIGNAARVVGGHIVNAIKKMGSWLKALASKLCRKVLKTVFKKVYKYVRKRVTSFCARICIKAGAKIWVMGGGSPAAAGVAAAISAGCGIGCKLAFDALVRYLRGRYMNGAKMDVFVSDFICDSVGLKTGQGNSSRRRHRHHRHRRHRHHRHRSSRRRRWRL